MRMLSFTDTDLLIFLVSGIGAMAERTKLESYCVFSLVNTLIYCFPAHWSWADNGFFKLKGAVDIAGAGRSHILTSFYAETVLHIFIEGKVDYIETFEY